MRFIPLRILVPPLTPRFIWVAITHPTHFSAMSDIFSRRTLSFHTAVLVLALLVLAGCDTFGDDDEGDGDAAASILIANQGNFGDGNGSVTAYDPATGEATEGVAPAQIGSTVQGALAEDGRYYLVANTAGRLNIYDSETLDPLGQSRVLGSNPRYVAAAGSETAYVTNQKFGSTSNVLLLDVSDPANPAVEDSVAVSGSPEGIALTEQRAYVALGAFSAAPLVAAISRSSREVVEEIDIGCFARFAFTDDEGEVLFPCNDADGNGAVVVLDGETGNERARIDLPGTVMSASGVTQAASYAPGAEELYVVLGAGRVARIETDGTASENVLAETLGPVSGDPIGALGYDDASGRLYLGRVPGFAQRGSVTIHRRDGTQVGQFTAGNAPTYVSFVSE